MNPGDVLEGQGRLLDHGRLVAEVDYHLTIPHQTHFFMNPTGKLRSDYDTHLGGFILVAPADEPKILQQAYTLELVSKTKQLIQLERRYKEIKHQGKPRVSYWVKAV